MPNIRLSPKHGVNPAIVHCFFCNEPTDKIALLGKLPGDAPAPMKTVIDAEPCATCAGYMEQGIILISVRDGAEGANPYRTGAWIVVTADAIERMLKPSPQRDAILRKRVAFIPDSVWNLFRLPR
jgi:hypothetical protein